MEMERRQHVLRCASEALGVRGFSAASWVDNIMRLESREVAQELLGIVSDSKISKE